METNDDTKMVMLSARIPADFHKKVKILCVTKGVSIQEFVHQALKEKYEREKES